MPHGRVPQGRSGDNPSRVIQRSRQSTKFTDHRFERPKALRPSCRKTSACSCYLAGCWPPRWPMVRRVPFG